MKVRMQGMQVGVRIVTGQAADKLAVPTESDIRRAKGRLPKGSTTPSSGQRFILSAVAALLSAKRGIAGLWGRRPVV